MARPININGMVNDILFKYDHNKNGAIDLRQPDGFKERLKNPDERQRSTTSSMMINDELRISTTTYSQRDLFYAADEDNDGKVTREELTEAVKAFDTNKDGELTSRGFLGWFKRKAKDELDLFNQQFGERVTNSSSVGVPLK